jgi:hypothetical protein
MFTDIYFSYVTEHRSDTLFIMKAPFTTNSQRFKRFVATAAEAIAHIKSVHKKIFGPCPTSNAIPYMMLQVKVLKNCEAKIVFLNGVYHHFLSPSTHMTTGSFEGFTKDGIINFASEAFSALSRNDEYILDGLVRVDLFQNNEGLLVVNEFESLEARYYASQQEVMMDTEEFLNNYWERKIYECIQMVPI